jgi:hypothetical protein
VSQAGSWTVSRVSSGGLVTEQGHGMLRRKLIGASKRGLITPNRCGVLQGGTSRAWDLPGRTLRSLVEFTRATRGVFKGAVKQEYSAKSVW